jgi:hypothetical protein
MPTVKNAGEPCAGEPHARIDGGREETRSQSVTPRDTGMPLANPTTPRRHFRRDPVPALCTLVPRGNRRCARDGSTSRLVLRLPGRRLLGGRRPRLPLCEPPLRSCGAGGGGAVRRGSRGFAARRRDRRAAPGVVPPAGRVLHHHAAHPGVARAAARWQGGWMSPTSAMTSIAIYRPTPRTGS